MTELGMTPDTTDRMKTASATLVLVEKLSSVEQKMTLVTYSASESNSIANSAELTAALERWSQPGG